MILALMTPPHYAGFCRQGAPCPQSGMIFRLYPLHSILVVHGLLSTVHILTNFCFFLSLDFAFDFMQSFIYVFENMKHLAFAKKTSTVAVKLWARLIYAAGLAEILEPGRGINCIW